ncbi:hypothetical protein I7X12_16700 [Halosimplex litoreum]|uniref:Uncharacterized protein n=1 Tax=Halosimplex litoreum TaxID=1198301 RepID=A0A7T3FX56_9EURY|nr:hypothetical protein [Halosimplex litoreum]QPV62361.1 hypothetical protein I7X12_16700 [Halosimplex litoreum]
MPDRKEGRDKQARDRENRQRRREIIEELERWEETEPPLDDSELDELDAELASVTFPATGADVVEAVGDRAIDSAEGTHDVAELVPRTETDTYEGPEAVRARVQRPTVAAAMKRVVEAADDHQSAEFGSSQYEAYERTLRELKAIDADDDDEGVEVIADWLVERIRERETLPGSRDVRRRAADFCRSNDYEVRNDEWLGV